tara:strand:+ start:456 stop:665 length:210 start_codon:yes stop_codon:yes gene_type:complete
MKGANCTPSGGGPSLFLLHVNVVRCISKAHFQHLYVYKRVDISVMVVCDAIGIEGYERRRSELFTTSIE